MRDIATAVKIVLYYRKNSVSLSQCYEAMGLENEMSIKKFKRLVNDIENFMTHEYSTPLSRKLGVLHILTTNINYYDYETFMNRLAFKVDPTTFRRYIKNIREAGFSVLYKCGPKGGYRLDQQLKF